MVIDGAPVDSWCAQITEPATVEQAHRHDGPDARMKFTVDVQVAEGAGVRVVMPGTETECVRIGISGPEGESLKARIPESGCSSEDCLVVYCQSNKWFERQTQALQADRRNVLRCR